MNRLSGETALGLAWIIALVASLAVLFIGEVEVLHVVWGTEKGVNTSCIGKLNLWRVLRPVAADAYE